MTLDEIRTKVKKLSDESRWSEMGWMFWNAFLFLPKGKERNAFSKAWKELPRSVKRLCESV